jgi:hypothetical protein
MVQTALHTSSIMLSKQFRRRFWFWFCAQLIHQTKHVKVTEQTHVCECCNRFKIPLYKYSDIYTTTICRTVT